MFQVIEDEEGNVEINYIGKVEDLENETETTISADLNCVVDSAIANKITLNVVTTDALGGVSKIVWYYKLSTESTYTETTDIYTETNESTEETTISVTKSKILTDLLLETTYNAYAVVYDVAGNSIQTETIEFTTSTAVAQIGTTYYTSLKNAVSAVENNEETTIVMLSDTTEATIDIGSSTLERNIIIDLNGKSITTTHIRTMQMANLEIKGDGNIYGISHAIYNYGNTTLSGGYYTSSGPYATVVNNTGNLTISNCEITYSGDYTTGPIYTYTGTKTIINSGKFYLSGVRYTVVKSYGALEIYGGDFYNENFSTIWVYGDTKIYNGNFSTDFTGDDENTTDVVRVSDTAEIYGGNFYSDYGHLVRNASGSNGKIYIYGGTFTCGNIHQEALQIDNTGYRIYCWWNI